MHQQGQTNTPAMTGLGRVPAPTGNFVSSVGSESSVCQDASTRVENQQKDCTKKEYFQALGGSRSQICVNYCLPGSVSKKFDLFLILECRSTVGKTYNLTLF